MSAEGRREMLDEIKKSADRSRKKIAKRNDGVVKGCLLKNDRKLMEKMSAENERELRKQGDE